MKLKIEYNNLLDNPEFSYFLGLLYADGCVKKINRNYNVIISTTEDDFDYFEKIFNVFCDFAIYSKKTPEYWKKSYIFSFSNKELYQYLLQIGFDDKPKNAQKIINQITDPVCRQLFFTGYFDGDGCVYYNQKQFLRQASITSSANQDWTFMINLCNHLGIKNYNITTTTTKKGHQSSNFRICNKTEFNIFLSYIYGNEKYGFQRKKEKFVEAMSSCRSELRFNPQLRPIQHTKKQQYS